MSNPDEFQTIQDCAGAVAEYLMATNNNDFRACSAIVDSWRALNLDVPQDFIPSIYDLLSAVHEREKKG